MTSIESSPSSHLGAINPQCFAAKNFYQCHWDHIASTIHLNGGFGGGPKWKFPHSKGADVWFLGFVFPNKSPYTDLALVTVHLFWHGQYESIPAPMQACCLLIAIDELGPMGIRFIFDSQDCKRANEHKVKKYSGFQCWDLSSKNPVNLKPACFSECLNYIVSITIMNVVCLLYNLEKLLKHVKAGTCM